MFFEGTHSVVRLDGHTLHVSRESEAGGRRAARESVGKTGQVPNDIAEHQRGANAK